MESSSNIQILIGVNAVQQLQSNPSVHYLTCISVRARTLFAARIYVRMYEQWEELEEWMSIYNILCLNVHLF